MKAMLIMDMPNGCCDCDFCLDAGETKHDFICRATLENGCFYKSIDFDVIYNYDERATWCPLREVPQKKEIAFRDSDITRIEKIGYNDCIDEILGGAENG